MTDPAAAEAAALRALRASRLARLRAAPEAAPDSAPGPRDAAAAGEAPLAAPPAPPGPAAAVLPFPRLAAPAPAAAASDPGLAALPGMGPGLAWALGRAGILRRADLAPLAPEDLAARLGPLGALVPAKAWIAAARG